MEHLFLGWLKEYGYVVLFFWSILEGELGLIMAGIMSHTDDMILPLAIAVGALGGFIGDQIYFYIGRFNKSYIHNKLRTQRRKFAIAYLLLRKYGWPLIFVQRYFYGMRTVIPMSIGLTKYSSRDFAIINFLSAVFWATCTIIPAYYFGKELLNIITWIKQHWYFAIPFALSIIGAITFTFHRIETNLLQKRHARKSSNQQNNLTI